MEVRSVSMNRGPSVLPSSFEPDRYGAPGTCGAVLSSAGSALAHWPSVCTGFGVCYNIVVTRDAQGRPGVTMQLLDPAAWAFFLNSQIEKEVSLPQARRSRNPLLSLTFALITGPLPKRCQKQSDFELLLDHGRRGASSTWPSGTACEHAASEYLCVVATTQFLSLRVANLWASDVGST